MRVLEVLGFMSVYVVCLSLSIYGYPSVFLGYWNNGIQHEYGLQVVTALFMWPVVIIITLVMSVNIVKFILSCVKN